MVRNVQGMNSPQMVRNIYGMNSLWYEKSSIPRDREEITQ